MTPSRTWIARRTPAQTAVAAALLPLAIAAPVGAQESADGTIPPATAAQSAAVHSAAALPTALEEIVVRGVVYRSRVEGTAPVLSYDLDYFQRFEPLTVGDMLKRTPSVAFLSDVLEYDGVRLRGLDPAYTQILINGRKVPGSGVDRSFFVDRIPAELVERVEIVRSTSADRSAEGVAGALNIILKDEASFEGGFIRGGMLHFDDSVNKGAFGAAYAGSAGDTRFWIGANVQGRRNPKDKNTNFFDGEDVFNDEVELESDVRNGTDYSFNAALSTPIGPATLDLMGFFVRTDRTEREDVQLFEGESLTLTELEAQDEDIEQDNASVTAALTLPGLGGRTRLELGFAQFTDDIVSTEFEADAGDPLQPSERETVDTTDEELSFTLAHARPLAGAELQFGLDWLSKDRDAETRVFEIDGDVLEEETPTNGIYRIEERRLDPFIRLSGTARSALKWELGVRFETTDVDVTGGGTSASTDYSFVSPSAHLRWELTPRDRLFASLSRTARRPDFDLLAPVEVEEHPADEDSFIGNPLLEPETAWGIDIGYERQLGGGVAGINIFHRRVDDVIELTSTGLPSDGGGLIYTAHNVGDGKVTGVELDLSAPLERIGLPQTGVFLNASWLDSEITDSILGTDRRFNDQPDYVVNAGFIHDMASFDGAFGLTFRKQGGARHVVLGEIRDTSYDGDLEAFLEKRFGKRIVGRLTVSNLLDAKKRETIYTFDGDSAEAIAAAMRAGEIDEIERESERAGPVVQLIVRAAF